MTVVAPVDGIKYTDKSPGGIGADRQRGEVRGLSGLRDEGPVDYYLKTVVGTVEISGLEKKEAVFAMWVPVYCKRVRDKVNQSARHVRWLGKLSLHSFRAESSCATMRFSHSSPTNPIINFDLWMEYYKDIRICNCATS